MYKKIFCKCKIYMYKNVNSVIIIKKKYLNHVLANLALIL